MKAIILITLTAFVLVKLISSSEDSLLEQDDEVSYCPEEEEEGEEGGNCPKKDLNCLEGEVFKKEYYRLTSDDEYVKMNTTLMCDCSKISKEINETNFIHYGFDLYYKLVYCIRSLNRKVTSCRIYQTCKKDLMYDYGVWRPGEQYVQDVEELCNCPQGLVCRTGGFLPKSMISPYDNVLSYRCVHPIEAELSFCLQNQVYLVEIYRNLSMLKEASEPVRLNSYVRCNCVTDAYTNIEEKTEFDHSDETIFIKTFRCPWWNDLSNASLYCIDHGICKKGFSSEIGIELPGVWGIKYHLKYCECKQGRLCTQTEDKDDQVIYRCYDPFDKYQCDQYELYKMEYFQLTQGSYSKMSTVLQCVCDRKYNDTKVLPLDSDRYQGIKRINCPEKPLNKTLPSCDYNEQTRCRLDVWNDYGLEHPGAMYKDYHEDMCDCGARKCRLQNIDTKFHWYKCVIESRSPIGHDCGKNAVFKVEYFSKPDNAIHIKQRTGFMCYCATHKSYRDSIIQKDPTLDNKWIKEYRCPTRPPTPAKTLKICEHRQICQTNHFNDYGSEQPGYNYVDFVIQVCICNRYRKCGYVETPNPTDRTGYQFCVPKSSDYSRMRDCKEGDDYKEEMLVENILDPKDLIRMDTRLICKCNNDRNKKTKNDPEKFPTEKNTWVKKFKCAKQPEKRLGPCFELQICKREFMYNYGKDRIGEEYVDTTEEYCECKTGSECIAAALIPEPFKSPFDKVLSYRCIEKKIDELRPCKKNELFLYVIFRYKPFGGSHSIKLNSYLKCKCETDSWTPSEEKPIEDPADTEEIIRRYTCPWRYRESVRRSCENYAICRKVYETDVGSEAPGKMMTHYYTTYCDCDVGRECLNVGKIGNETIHRCFLNRTSNMRKSCKHNEVFRADIIRKNRTRMNTIEMCRCLGEKYIWNVIRDPNFLFQIIKLFACNIPQDYRQTQTYMELPYCEKEEVCMTHKKNSSGLERPQNLYDETSIPHCKCTFPRICKEVEEKTNALDKCLVVSGLKYKMYACSPDQLYLHVLYLNKTRMNTIVMCVCEFTKYDEYKEKKNSTRYPQDVKRTLESHYCPRPKLEINEKIDSCVDYAVCKKELRGNYGKDIDSDLKYLHYSILFCLCGGDRNCTKVGNESTPHTEYTIDIFRCLPNIHKEKIYRCRSEQKFLITATRNKPLPSTDRKDMNNFFRCRCDFNAERFKQISIIYDYDDDTTGAGDMIFTAYCPAHEPYDFSPCKENEDCYVEEHVNFGEERPGSIFVNDYRLCDCIGTRVCIRHRREETEKGFKYIHRCERKFCNIGEVCRVLDFSVHKELIDMRKICICGGKCSIRDHNSTYTSVAYGNETTYHDCKYDE